jgi:hypothetical protein
MIVPPGVVIHNTGVRPRGRGLLTYLFHYLCDDDGVVGVMGYDPILGTMSPVLRLLCHCSAILMAWGTSSSIVLLLCSMVSSTVSRHGGLCKGGTDIVPIHGLDLVGMCGLAVVALYLALWYVLHHVLPGVSDPGGPRPAKIQRVPAWPDKTWTTTMDTTTTIAAARFVTGLAGHEVTEAEFAGTSGALTGEPAGRDIWTTTWTTTKPNANLDDNKLILEMACGGRPAGFNPHVNPNR